MKMWLISDTHFHHHNIIEYGERPFKDVKEMNEVLTSNWNETVKPEDHVYHLGDVSILRGNRGNQERFIETIRALNGHKRVIPGNHDHFMPRVYIDAGFEKILGSGQWFGNGLLLSHYPIHAGSLGRAIANVHGHIHQNDSPAPQFIKGMKPGFGHDKTDNPNEYKVWFNVSVEAIGYRPIDMDQVIEKVGQIREGMQK